MRNIEFCDEYILIRVKYFCATDKVLVVKLLVNCTSTIVQMWSCSVSRGMQLFLYFTCNNSIMELNR